MLPNLQQRVIEALAVHDLPGLTAYELFLCIYGPLEDPSRARMLTLFIAAEADSMSDRGQLVTAIIRGGTYSYTLSDKASKMTPPKGTP